MYVDLNLSSRIRVSESSCCFTQNHIGNLLVDTEGNLKLCDLGLARSILEMGTDANLGKAVTMNVGTPFYMACALPKFFFSVWSSISLWKILEKGALSSFADECMSTTYLCRLQRS